MRNRLVVLSAVLAFAMAVAAVAVVAGKGGDGDGRLEKLSFAFAGGGERSTMAAGGHDASYPEFGRLEYEVRGELPELGGEAPAYRLAGDTTRAAVEKLASDLGLEGDVEENEGGWAVRDDGRELSVVRVPGLPWHLSPRCADVPVSSGDAEGVVSSGCVRTAVALAGGSGSGSVSAPSRGAATAVAPPSPPTTAMAGCGGGSGQCAQATEAPTTTAMPPCPPGAACAYSEAPARPAPPPASGAPPCDGGPPRPCFPESSPPPVPSPPSSASIRPEGLPSKAEAERFARSLLTELGVGLDGFALYDGFSEWLARVQPNVAGLPTVGWDHSVSVGPNGQITAGNGFLARPERIGDYPLAGTAKGLERLRAGAGTGPRNLGAPVEAHTARGDLDCAKPTLICDRPAPVTTVACAPNAECMAPSAPGLPPPPPRPPAPVPAPPPRLRPPVLTVTGVHLALQHVEAALVPVYVFELERGGESFPVPAVTDEWIERHREDQPRVRSRNGDPVPLAPPPAPTPTVAHPAPPSGAEPGGVPTQPEGRQPTTP